MPATFAHPIVAVPLARGPLLLPALVVGTIAPDFEYLFTISPSSTISHTLAGLFTFCLPVGIVVLWLWHRFFKQALVELLPGRHSEALAPLCREFRFGPTSRLLLIGACIFLGAATHLLWDGFTHSFGWAVGKLPALSTPLLETPYGTLRLYKVLQHGSTLLGSALLLALYVRWLSRAPTRDPGAKQSLSARLRWSVIAAVVLAAGAAGLAAAWASLPTPGDLDTARAFVIRVMLVGGATFAGELVGVALWWRQNLILCPACVGEIFGLVDFFNAIHNLL